MRTLLGASVLVPACSFIAFTVYGVQFTDAWASQPDPDSNTGLALCGLFGITPIVVLIVALELRAVCRLDPEALVTVSYGCWLGVAMSLFTVGDGVTMWIGLKPGNPPVLLVLIFAVIAAYFAVVGFGHRWLAQVVQAGVGKAGQPNSPSTGIK